jgi:hypothetical protein
MNRVDQTIAIFSLRSISTTESGWISQTSTTMEDGSDMSLRLARAENLMNLHSIIGTEPPDLGFALRIQTAWRPPTDDMKVRIKETVIEQDLMTGMILGEQEVEEYEITYAHMGA